MDKEGEQRRLKTNSGRQRLNLHDAINAETMEMTVIESETIKSRLDDTATRSPGSEIHWR